MEITGRMQQLLEQLYDDLTSVARSTNRIYKNVKSQEHFTRIRKFKKEYRDSLGYSSSIENLLNLWAPTWKMSPNGYTVRLNEGNIFNINPEKELCVYDVHTMIFSLFKN